MAKKIRVEGNLIISNEEVKETKKIYRILLVISLIILVSFVIFSLYISNKYAEVRTELDKTNAVLTNTKKELSNTEDELEDVHNSLFSILKGEYNTYYINDKLDFFDEKIVFVLEGYGNKYYTYDCVQKIVDGDYTFWAYNVEAAIVKGYKEGTC